MYGYSQFGPARMIFGRKGALKLAMLKLGVEVVLRVGSFIQRRGRTAPSPRTRFPA